MHTSNVNNNDDDGDKIWTEITNSWSQLLKMMKQEDGLNPEIQGQSKKNQASKKK